MQKLSEIAELLAGRDGEPTAIAIVKAASHHVLDAVVPAVENGWIYPILIDSSEAINRALNDRIQPGKYEVIDCEDPAEAAQMGVQLVREGRASCLMKGILPTGVFLKPVVNSETGIRASELLSHVAVVENESIGRLVAITDGGMVPAPTAQDLPALIEHGRLVMSKLGVQSPKVSLLSAAENVIRKLPSSVMQAEYVESAGDPNLAGPLSLDISLVPEIAKEKGYTGPIQGDADILVAPDIVAGNALTKSLVLFGGGAMAGVICGASVPIVLTSRSASHDEKYYSIALASVMGAK